MDQLLSRVAPNIRKLLSVNLVADGDNDQNCMNWTDRIAPGRSAIGARGCLTSIAAMFITCNVYSAESIGTADSLTPGFWEIIIALFVTAVAASVAYLCYGAARLWLGYWRLLAIAPLAILAFWLLITTAGMSNNALWTFELLAWAMATTVYLVVLFTARRAFEKAASENKTVDSDP